MAKKSKIAKVLEHQKESTFGWVYNIFSSAPSPYNEKYPNLEASWDMERRTFGSVYDVLVSSLPWQKISKFAKILGMGRVNF